MKHLYILTLALFPLTLFSQPVERKPTQQVRNEQRITMPSEFVSEDGVRTTVVHEDGSKTITVTATEVSPSNYSNNSPSQNATVISSFAWTKTDLELYIMSLEQKKLIVSNNQKDHESALESGWYDFINEMIRQSNVLLEQMN